MKKIRPSYISARSSTKHRTRNGLDEMEKKDFLHSNKNNGAFNSIYDRSNNSKSKSSRQTNRKRRGKRYKDKKLKMKMVGSKSLKKILTGNKRMKETEISYSFDESSFDSWDSSIEGPLKSLKKMIKPKLMKKIDTSTAVIATLPNLPNQESRKEAFNSETDGDSNDDDIVDELVFTNKDIFTRPSHRRNPSRDTSFTVDELLSLIQESSDRSASSFHLDVLLRKQHEIVDIQKNNSQIDEISVFTPEEEDYEDSEIRLIEKLKTAVITLTSLASIFCAVESIRKLNVLFINIACAVSIVTVSYTAYQQCKLMSARAENMRAKKLIVELDGLIQRKKDLLERINILREKSRGLYHVENQLAAFAAGTPNSLTTVILKAKAAKFLSSEVKTFIRTQIIYTIFKSMHVTSRRNDELALTTIGVEVMTQKLCSIEYIKFYPSRFESHLASSNYSLIGLLQAIKQLFDDEVPPEKKMFELPFRL